MTHPHIFILNREGGRHGLSCQHHFFMFRFPHYFFLLFCLYGYVFHPPAQAETVEYDLYVRNTPVNFTERLVPP